MSLLNHTEEDGERESASERGREVGYDARALHPIKEKQHTIKTKQQKEKKTIAKEVGLN